MTTVRWALLAAAVLVLGVAVAFGRLPLPLVRRWWRRLRLVERDHAIEIAERVERVTDLRWRQVRLTADAAAAKKAAEAAAARADLLRDDRRRLEDQMRSEGELPDDEWARRVRARHGVGAGDLPTPDV